MSVSSCGAMPHLLPYEATCSSSSCPPLPWRRGVVDTVVVLMPSAASPAASPLNRDPPTSHLAAVMMTITRVPIRAIYSSNPHIIPVPSAPPSTSLLFLLRLLLPLAISHSFGIIGERSARDTTQQLKPPEKKKKKLSPTDVVVGLRNSPSSDK